MKARLLATIRDSIQNNIQSSIQAYTKAHTQVVELTQDSMQTSIKSYILVTGQLIMLVNMTDSLKVQEHTQVNILETSIRFI